MRQAKIKISLSICAVLSESSLSACRNFAKNAPSEDSDSDNANTQADQNLLWAHILKCISGWSGVAEVSCILRHRGVQMRLAYSWARPDILVAGQGRGGNVFISSVSSLSFLFLFLSCPSLLSPVLSILSLSPLSLGDDTKWPTRVDLSLNPNSINQNQWYVSWRFSSFDNC